MKVMILKNESWRFFFFVESGQNYVFDCFTNKIYTLNNELTELLGNQRYHLIKMKYHDFYHKVLEHQEIKPKTFNKKNEKCIATINFSNNCNLNCKYCYRNKNNKDKMSKKDLESLVRFLKYEFMPEATEYIFSLCYTSESSLDIDYLVFFDSLIAKYEGYLLSEEKFSNVQANEIYNWLPAEIKDKYKINSKCKILPTLNQILQNEKLWKYWDYSKNSYLCTLLNNRDELSLSKTVIANRQIIDDNFKLFNTKDKIKYMSMSFMTNATNITDEYIQLLKKLYINDIWVSLDGNEISNNHNRLYPNGNSSYFDALKGIKKLQENGIAVRISAVITPENNDVFSIVQYLASLNVKEIGIGFLRGKYKFSENSIKETIKSIEKIYEEIFTELKENRYKLFPLLKGNLFFYKVFDLYTHKRALYRCNWGTEVVIDNEGNFFHCNSTIGNKKDNLGNWKTKIDEKKLWCRYTVNHYKNCCKCWAKYLCGGTCYAEITNKNTKKFNNECIYRKELMIKMLRFYVKLHRNNLIDKYIEFFLK